MGEYGVIYQRGRDSRQEEIDGLMGEVAALKAQVERLKAPVKFERGEVVRVDNERYHGEGTFEEETLHRYGVMLEHGGIRYYEPETVHKLAARAAAPATGAEQKDGD